MPPRRGRSEYAEAVRLRPAYAEAWLGLGAAYGSMGDLARAAACHEKALALAPDKTVMRAWPTRYF